MELDFDKIIRIRKIRSVKSDLSKEENTLSRPVLSDKKLIPEIHKVFTSLIVERGCKPATNTVIQRKKFIFIFIPRPLWPGTRWLPDCVMNCPMCWAYRPKAPYPTIVRTLFSFIRIIHPSVRMWNTCATRLFHG